MAHDEAAAIVADALADPVLGSEEYQLGWKDARAEALRALEHQEDES